MGVGTLAIEIFRSTVTTTNLHMYQSGYGLNEGGFMKGSSPGHDTWNEEWASDHGVGIESYVWAIPYAWLDSGKYNCGRVRLEFNPNYPTSILNDHIISAKLRLNFNTKTNIGMSGYVALVNGKELTSPSMDPPVDYEYLRNQDTIYHRLLYGEIVSGATYNDIELGPEAMDDIAYYLGLSPDEDYSNNIKFGLRCYMDIANIEPTNDPDKVEHYGIYGDGSASNHPLLEIKHNALYEDVSQYIFGARSERGRDEILDQAQTGVLDLTLDNFTGYFNPDNGHLNIGDVIVFSETYDGTKYKHFTGKVDKVIPHDEPHQAICVVKVLDGMDDLEGNKIVTPLRLDTDAGTLADDVLDAVGWPIANRSIEAGTDILQLGWFHRIKGLAAMHVLEDVELGIVYVDVNGKLVFENRRHRVIGEGLNPQHDFEDTPKDIAYEYSKQFLRNEITIKGRRYFVGAIMVLPGYDVGEIEAELIWTSHTGDAGAPYIPQNSTVTIWADMGGPIYLYTSLVRGTHWDANTAFDGTGLDLGANVAITETQYGQTIKLEIGNGNSEGVYIVVPGSPPMGAPSNRTLLIYGTLYMAEEMIITEPDQTSIDTYGKRELTIDAPFKSNPNDVLAYGQFLLAKYKDPVPLAVQVDHDAMSNWPDDTLKVQCLSREISDRITIKSTKLSIDEDYYINKVIQEYERFGGGFEHNCTWIIERARGGMAEGRYWLLGVAGYSELGETTILGF